MLVSLFVVVLVVVALSQGAYIYNLKTESKVLNKKIHELDCSNWRNSIDLQRSERKNTELSVKLRKKTKELEDMKKNPKQTTIFDYIENGKCKENKVPTFDEFMEKATREYYEEGGYKSIPGMENMTPEEAKNLGKNK